jgi:hypothetical protein
LAHFFGSIYEKSCHKGISSLTKAVLLGTLGGVADLKKKTSSTDRDVTRKYTRGEFKPSLVQ